MKLRQYQESDSAIIGSWIKDKKSLYQWSADRICKFPLEAYTLNETYQIMAKENSFYPMTVCNECDIPIGHLFIRYPNAADRSFVRFGFVIVDPKIRKCGNGKKMLQMAINYAFHTLDASIITLGVFANNESARYCYEAVGFCPSGENISYQMPDGIWECIEMELKKQ